MTRSTQHLGTDAAITAIETARRRHALRYLRQTDQSAVALSDLASAVAERTEDDSSLSAVEDVTVELHHRDLPVLSDEGVLDYDSRTQTVRYDGNRGVELLLYVIDEQFQDG